ncbi:MAG TPA: STAS domain-containing protein [Acidimicrobiia bacterium]|nr:STAS domain-containing protein [Acidimicrobiia bacterium]
MIEVVREGADAVVYLRGEGDMASCELWRQAIQPLLGPDETVVIDLGAVTFMDSSCLAVLVHGRSVQDEQGGKFVVRNPTETTRKVLAVSGLEFLLDAD